MRLIDADALMKFITEQAETPTDEIIASVCRGAALSMPAVDAVPVVHGEWVLLKYWTNVFQCSKRGHYEASYNGTYPRDDRPFLVVFYPPKISFCPNCGAKMDGGADNGK